MDTEGGGRQSRRLHLVVVAQLPLWRLHLVVVALLLPLLLMVRGVGVGVAMMP